MIDPEAPNPSTPAGPVIIVGTAATAKSVIAQLRSLGSASPRVVGTFLVNPDDSVREDMIGAPLMGEVEDLPDVCAQLGVRTAIVSLPAALSKALARVRATLRAANIGERFFPPITDMLADTALFVRGGSPRIDLAALVGRQPRSLDESRVRELLQGKRALITGAGGSIGSELARRCAAAGVGELILLERSENALFDIDRQVGALFPAVKRKVVLHDVVEADATLRRFVALRPQVVFHAAAHKHVPMMEDHPAAAVNNNLFGTKSVADASIATGVERFVMISTDKAVNPTSVMGATKRLAEIYVTAANDTQHRTRCCLVRFGNVLGSNCSVLPIWSAQIAEGGPVTVTHPEMTRYFMTIPEAASLVIQAATVNDDHAEVLVLDMGEPVLIKGLAERFIRAHGLVPDWNQQHPESDEINSIRVLFTGARPGEKLHEELSYSAEELRQTPVPGVLAWKGKRPQREQIMQMVAEMSGVRHAETPSVVLDAIKRQLAMLDGPSQNHLLSADAA
ncbi:MAG: polysaccharide biosynthesis protein [Phycisphaerae bacterium]|nr:polysaccharide biosynthesis protein [Phycisphaerae bacterium]